MLDGPAIDPASLPAPPNTVAVRSAPHAQVLDLVLALTWVRANIGDDELDPDAFAVPLNFAVTAPPARSSRKC